MKTCPYCFEEIQDAAIKCKHCGEMLDGAAAPAGSGSISKKLYRSRNTRMVSGICGGLAAMVNMDATVVRLIVALGTLVTGILPGLIVYVVAAMIVPEEPAHLNSGS